MSAEVAESLFWIVLASVLAPLVAALVPRRLVPEVVLLLGAGIMIGQFGLDIAEIGPEIDMLQELGLGLLFLLAGYELDPRELTGPGGRRALITWLACLACGFAIVFALATVITIRAEVAVAIAVTSTALGTLLPILAERGLLDTPLGRTVLNHGAFGELCPVVAMAILLGSRGAVGSLLVLTLFALAAVVVAALPRRVGSRAVASVVDDPPRGRHHRANDGPIDDAAARRADRARCRIRNRHHSGAFAAGFILRRLMPEGDERLEAKLGGLAFGLLVPVFFVTSGMNIDVEAVARRPGLLFLTIAVLLLVRGLPVFVATGFERDGDGNRASTGANVARSPSTPPPACRSSSSPSPSMPGRCRPPTPPSSSPPAGSPSCSSRLSALLLGRGEARRPRPADERP